MTSRPIETLEIDGYTYHVTLLGARQGNRMWIGLVRRFGGCMPGIQAAIRAELKGETSDLGDVLKQAVQELEESHFEAVCDTMAQHTAVSGKEHGSKQPRLFDLFDEHFVGQYGAMMRWLLFCLKANFQSFLGGISIVSPSAPIEERA